MKTYEWLFIAKDPGIFIKLSLKIVQCFSSAAATTCPINRVHYQETLSYSLGLYASSYFWAFILFVQYFLSNYCGGIIDMISEYSEYSVCQVFLFSKLQSQHFVGFLFLLVLVSLFIEPSHFYHLLVIVSSFKPVPFTTARVSFLQVSSCQLPG